MIYAENCYFHIILNNVTCIAECKPHEDSMDDEQEEMGIRRPVGFIVIARTEFISRS